MIERLAITDQDSKLPSRYRSGNLHRDLADNRIAAIRTKHCLNREFVSGSSFGHVGSRGLKVSGAALRSNVKLEINAVEAGRGVGVFEDAPKVLGYIHRRKHRTWRGFVRAAPI